jgi:signal transduction histidine kinase
MQSNICRIQLVLGVKGGGHKADTSIITTNLIANAIKHGEPGRPIRVRASTDEQELTLTVVNEGDPDRVDPDERLF